MPEKSMDAISVEVHHLQEGQRRIVDSIDKLSGKMDHFAEAMIQLVRHSEKIQNALDRIQHLEAESEKRSEVAARGDAVMSALPWAIPLVFGIVFGYIGYVHSVASDHSDKIEQLRLDHAENHPRTTR
jgi:FtsZ-binding cell division protein ZapB